MSTITPCLWFDGRAEEAAVFYVATFRDGGHDAAIGDILRYGENAHGPTGSVMTVGFTLDGQEFIALNGGPEYRFTPAISLMVNCRDQREIDWFWDRLTDGGKPVQCGWLEDRFGVSWQVVPAPIFTLLKDPARSEAVMQALLGMVKPDLAALEAAAG
ncbi:MAG TPA: VOC family protein [Azospirillum sp.]|nr:VOC family protein [Azospirillum sp.]